MPILSALFLLVIWLIPIAISLYLLVLATRFVAAVELIAARMKQ